MSERWYIPNILRDSSSPLSQLVLENRGELAYGLGGDIDVEALTDLSSEDLIDRFLEGDSHRRIVAQQEPSGQQCGNVQIAPVLSEEEDIVSEELANIYLMQGLNDEAIAIYRKLSLLNSEKSVYFAELIAKAQRGV